MNLLEKFDTVLKAANNNKTVDVLYGPQPNLRFIPFNFRTMDTTVGFNTTSRIHHGESITRRCRETTYKHLLDTIDFKHQLSFFSVTQQSALGGELVIYHYPKSKYPTLNDLRYLQTENGDEDLFATENKTVVQVQDGDLIIFSGGELWHRVQEIKDGERVSLGGFLARDLEKNWFYWI